MTEIKVGEKYLLKRGLSNASKKYAGETVTVSELRTNWCYIKEHETGGIWLNELEAITEKSEVKFKKGDQVKIVGHHWAEGGKVAGMQDIISKTGIIGEDRDDDYLNVRVDGRDNFYGLIPGDLELISEGPTVTETRQITVKNGNISVNHTVGSKKGRVSFTGFRQAGHINIEDLDKVIEMLQRLKGEL